MIQLIFYMTPFRPAHSDPPDEYTVSNDMLLLCTSLMDTSDILNLLETIHLPIDDLKVASQMYYLRPYWYINV